MNKSELPDRRLFLLLIALGACARLVPHPWNFTPMMAIGLYAGARTTKVWAGILLTVAALLLSDAVLGFYSGMLYVYAASLVPVLLGRLARRPGTGVGFLASSALVSSVSFFIITNAAVWATDHLYAHTWGGLASCFVAALPFYRNEMAGDAFYTCALFGAEALFRASWNSKPQVA
jgi:hypothetical protein